MADSEELVRSTSAERPKMVNKLYKLTLQQALDAAEKWHRDMAKRSERIRREQGKFGGDPNATKTVMEVDSFRWVRITSAEGLDYEGNVMGHCVGHGSYDHAVIYSLRDEDNFPHCTIEWDPDTRSIEQVQGRANQAVGERYHG